MSDRIFNATGFYEYLSEHKLMGCRDKASGRFHLPPRRMDPTNHSTDMEWEEVSGKGKLLAFTVITVPTPAMVDAGYGKDNPYCVGIVQLEEGPAISGQIFGVDMQNPENIKIGTALQATFIERGQEPNKQTLLGFEPV